MHRRDIIKGLAASSVLLGASAITTPLFAGNDHSFDVIVIGAGLAGLTSAEYLKNQGYKVLVLEARERVGGRILTLNNQLNKPEVGGLQIGQGYGLMRTYAQRLSLPLVSLGNYAKQTTYVVNEQIINAADWPSHVANQLSKVEKNTLPSALYFKNMAKGPAFGLPTDWTSPKYTHLDIPLLEYFKQQQVSDEALRLINANLNAQSLQNLSAADAFYRLSLARAGGRGAHRVEGGNGRFTDALANNLQGELQTQKEVTHINQQGQKVKIRCGDGSEYNAKRAIITTPFSVLKNVELSGTISHLKRKAINEAFYTPVTQVHFSVKKQADVSMLESNNLWTDNALGRVFSQTNDKGELTYLTSWINGQQAQQLDTLPEVDAIKIVQQSLHKYYPGLKDKVEVVHHQSWANEKFSKGAYIQFAAGQVQSLVPHMATVEDKLHFAGEHTEFMNSGMESAMVSGLRAAQEVMGKV
ncbi:flavin monoamine oxidase family protein [Paraglaciecola arctica]|uniref:flavin monoamine oxidase family protein n=1 Tax=Paraglaciecola arctica TaxID=1128911 RepID=UPI001C07A2C3|nr:NAD(P)/FAD-dependent oxidoreductase [Paraglaciecola arctica]MBU3002593.1 FAD-dependent oxidoreductase [Paraglaciecola arctica]